MNKSICVIGLGYIGLPMAAILAKSGYIVHGVDINASIVNLINQGKTHIQEPGLKNLVKEAVEKDTLHASQKPQKSDVFLICVPTPLKNDSNNFQPDISYVISAIDSIIDYLTEDNLIILESTSPPGTTKVIHDRLIKLGYNIHIAYCPERIIPGNAIQEITAINRVVGGTSEEATKRASEFYSSFVTGEILCTDSTTAELVKLSENSFRDINIAFANELSLIADQLGVNVQKLIEFANFHPRVNILQPGIGVGGHCIAVDPWFLASSAPDTAQLISAARKVNEGKTQWVIKNIGTYIASIERTIPKPLIVLLGLAYKPNIGDLRESPAVKIAHTLIEHKFNIICVEPYIDSHETLPLETLNVAIAKANIIVLLVKHNIFNITEIKENANNALFLDYIGGE